jgi:acyl-CoA synthetase (AMP-forming)/AMP-acid ligase II
MEIQAMNLDLDENIIRLRVVDNAVTLAGTSIPETYVFDGAELNYVITHNQMINVTNAASFKSLVEMISTNLINRRYQ